MVALRLRETRDAAPLSHCTRNNVACRERERRERERREVRERGEREVRERERCRAIFHLTCMHT